MRFEWDDLKNRSNFRKHKIWFEEAQTLWSDPRCAEFFDPEHSVNEDRYIRIGYSTNNRILLVVYCEKTDNQAVRIISARKATIKEREAYEEGI
jgi:uncharacterized DUF497 family protein